MRRLILPFLIATALWAQTPGAPPSNVIQFYGAGGGVHGFGPAQMFAYSSLSQCFTGDTCTTEINEYVRMKGGTVGTSARAGVSKVLYRFGPFTAGLVGDVGVAEGPTGSASGALSGRGFVLGQIRKSHWYYVLTGQILKTAGVGQSGTATIGFLFRL